MKKDTANKGFWERFAFIYTPFMRKNSAAYEKICAVTSEYLDESMDVLELACGTGQITFSMVRKVRSWTATDFSENMINEAKKRLDGNDSTGNITFTTADATSLSYEDESFDAVVIANALHIMPDPDSALSEIHRVLKSGGIVSAPTFVYEKGYSKPLICLMERAGFKTYHKWTKSEFETFVAGKGFSVCRSELIKGEPLSECVFIGKKA